MNFSPLIYAFGQENIAITGKGALDGGASNETWWGWNPKDPALREKGPSLQNKDRDALGAMMEEGVPPEQRVFGKGRHLRPNFIQPYRCRNILLEGVTIDFADTASQTGLVFRDPKAPAACSSAA